MNKFKSSLLALVLTYFLFSTEIEIALPTENKEITIYIASAKSFHLELEQLVNYIIPEDFILDDRGIVFEKNALFLTFEKTKGEALYTNEIWQKNKIDYVIVPELIDKKITIHLYNVRKGALKTLSEINLEASKEITIKSLHKACDFLMEQIYGKSGIASKRIIYSHKPYKKEADETTLGWTSEIYETDYLGMFNKQITSENSYCISPEFTKKIEGIDDYEFFFVSYKLGQPQIYLGKNDYQPCKPLIKLCGNQLLPKLSYDGSYLSFVSDATGKSDIFIQKIDKNNQPIDKPIQVYSGILQTSASPSLSPDNKLMAFVSDKSGSANIYIAFIEKTLLSKKPPEIEKLISPCSECTSPCFSGDGRKIVFSGKINGRRQIWLYDITKKLASQLTIGDQDKENPCFGSDGRHIVYNTTSPTTELFILSLGKNKIRKLTKGFGDNHYPAFEK